MDEKYLNRKVDTKKFPKVRLTVTKARGYCYRGYKEGDVFLFDDFTTPTTGFCQGAMHSIFPCIYALTFGAEFPFMDNTRSILTACPDGGKLEFKSELLDEFGNVIFKAKQLPVQPPNPKKMIAKVEEVNGKCTYCYNIGDEFEFKGLKTKEGFCGAGYHTLFPALFALNFGAKYWFEEDENKLSTITCPDGAKIRFSLRRVNE